MSILSVLIFIIVFIVALLWIVGSKYVSKRRADEIHFVRTVDRWPIALHRYPPRKKRAGLAPIIFCHGLGANRFNFDLDDNLSLAVTLANMGYDVFLLELRGIGFSRREKLFYPGKWDICFDDFVEKDIPAAIDFVTEFTGNKKVHWVGHSMGGMVAYAFCQFSVAKKIKSVSAIAGPGNLTPLRPKLMPLINLMFLAKPFPVLHQSFFIKLYAPLAVFLKRNYFLRFLFNSKVMQLSAMKKAAANLISDVPFKLLFQFGQWVKFGDMFSLEGYSYRANFHKIKKPFLFISGEKDVLAGFQTVEEVYKKISSKDKKHVHFSSKSGTTDYGHGDIVISDAARLEVYPVVINWIEEHK